MKLFVNLQDRLEAQENVKLEQELRPRSLIGRFEREFLLESTLLRFDPSSEKKPIDKVLKINYFIEQISDNRIREKIDFQQKYQRKHKVNVIDIIANFLKYFATKFSSRPCQFDIKKGKIK